MTGRTLDSEVREMDEDTKEIFDEGWSELVLGRPTGVEAMCCAHRRYS
jgi:hypothetical protein